MLEDTNMKWFSKDPPLYVWEGDTWERESDHMIFLACKSGWNCAFTLENVPYTKKTRFKGEI